MHININDYLESTYYFTYFPQSSYPTFVCFFPVGLSLLIQHFQQVLLVLKFHLLIKHFQEISCETSTPTRPLESVVLTTKGLQERDTQMLDGTSVEK